MYAPRRLVLAIPSDDPAGNAAEVPALFAAKPALAGGVAYVCRGTQCSPPLTSLADLVAELGR